MPEVPVSARAAQWRWRNKKARTRRAFRYFDRCFGNVKSCNGASGETRTLTLSPETDFESAASTDSATEAMAAEYRDVMTVGQSGFVVRMMHFR